MKFAKAKDSAANENAIDPKEQAGGEEDDDDDGDEAAAVKPKKIPKKPQRVESSSSEAHLPEECGWLQSLEVFRYCACAQALGLHCE